MDELQDTVKESVQEFPLQEQEQEEDQDQVEDQGREIAREPEPEAPHPSLLTFREFCIKPVNQAQENAITSVITDLGLWRQVLTEWSLRGHNTGNVRGLLDWYRDGIPPVNRNGNHGTHTKRSEPSNGDDPPKLDPELQRQFDERRKRSQGQSP